MFLFFYWLHPFLMSTMFVTASLVTVIMLVDANQSKCHCCSRQLTLESECHERSIFFLSSGTESIIIRI